MTKYETGAVSTANALKMAIEAMQSAYSSHGKILPSYPAQDAWMFHGCDAKLYKSIEACKEALEQPEDYLYVYKGSEMWLKDSLDIPSAGFLIGKIRLEK